MHEERDTPHDTVIDEVAASLTRQDPPVAMRSSIRSRLEASAAPDARWRSWEVGIAAAVVAVLSVVVFWSDRQPSDTVATARPTASDVMLPPDAALSQPPRPPRATVVTRSTPEVPTDSTVGVDMLDVVPLGMEPLDISTLVVEGLSLEPLTWQQ